MIKATFDTDSPGTLIDRIAADSPKLPVWTSKDPVFKAIAMEILCDERLVDQLVVHTLYPRNTCPQTLAYSATRVDPAGVDEGEHFAVYVEVYATEVIRLLLPEVACLVLRKAADRLLEAWGRIERGEPSGCGFETIEDQVAAWVRQGVRGEGNGVTKE